MAPRHFLPVALVAILASPILAQNWTLKPGSDRSDVRRSSWDHGRGGFPGRIGIFPVIQVSGPLARGFVLEHLVFGNPRGNAVRQARSASFLFHRGVSLASRFGFGSQHRNYSSSFFIERWKAHQPTNTTKETDEARSILLEPGFSEEKVMRALGSPVERIRLADKEIWKYSGYSLVFISGRLEEIR